MPNNTRPDRRLAVTDSRSNDHVSIYSPPLDPDSGMESQGEYDTPGTRTVDVAWVLRELQADEEKAAANLNELLSCDSSVGIINGCGFTNSSGHAYNMERLRDKFPYLNTIRGVDVLSAVGSGPDTGEINFEPNSGVAILKLRLDVSTTNPNRTQVKITDPTVRDGFDLFVPSFLHTPKTDGEIFDTTFHFPIRGILPNRDSETQYSNKDLFTRCRDLVDSNIITVYEKAATVSVSVHLHCSDSSRINSLRPTGYQPVISYSDAVQTFFLGYDLFARGLVNYFRLEQPNPPSIIDVLSKQSMFNQLRGCPEADFQVTEEWDESHKTKTMSTVPESLKELTLRVRDTRALPTPSELADYFRGNTSEEPKSPGAEELLQGGKNDHCRLFVAPAYDAKDSSSSEGSSAMNRIGDYNEVLQRNQGGYEPWAT